MPIVSQTVNPLELQVLALLSRVLEETADTGSNHVHAPRVFAPVNPPLDVRPEAPRPSKAAPVRSTPLAP